MKMKTNSKTSVTLILLFPKPLRFWISKFTKFISSTEQLANSLRLLSMVPSVQAAVFLCFRVLLLRMSADHVTSLWPIIIAEMVHVFLAMEQELKSDGEDLRWVFLGKIKRISLIIVALRYNRQPTNAFTLRHGRFVVIKFLQQWFEFTKSGDTLALSAAGSVKAAWIRLCVAGDQFATFPNVPLGFRGHRIRCARGGADYEWQQWWADDNSHIANDNLCAAHTTHRTIDGHEVCSTFAGKYP